MKMLTRRKNGRKNRITSIQSPVTIHHGAHQTTMPGEEVIGVTYEELRQSLAGSVIAPPKDSAIHAGGRVIEDPMEKIPEGTTEIEFVQKAGPLG
jgi:hypothetical protein